MAKRNLYLKNTDVETALNDYLLRLETLISRKCELIEAAGALGRITAKAVFARLNSPLCDSAAMDGVAVVSTRTNGASEANPVTLKGGADFIIVDTGDPVKPPFDAVIMAEDIHELEGGDIEILEAAPPWQHIRPVGEDIVQGEMILPRGHIIRPVDIGVLLSGGITKIDVLKRPEVAIFPTGSEIVEPGSEVKSGDIIESNSRMFEGMVRQSGGEPHRFPIIPDDRELLKARVREAAERYDMVLVNAGSSAGTEDYTVHVLRELGEIVAHGVAMKPGKPVILAVVNGKPVIGLPGYPVSAYLAYERFAQPVLDALSGRTGADADTVKAVLTRRLVSSLKYREYVRVKVGRVGGRMVASPLARGAGAAMSLVRADGFCVIGQDMEGIDAGEEVVVELTRPLNELEGTVVSIGSHDLILDVLADLLPNRYKGVHLSSTHVGSMGGLLALRKAEAHIAPMHLLDEDSGEYNIHILKRLFDTPVSLIKGVGRIQGIMVAKGNPLGIKGIADLKGARYVNRQRGAGTRVLLDYLIKHEDGLEPEDIPGYDREAATHMAVAAAVQSGSADAGMGILSAANAMGLDFIPVRDEEYDFAVPREFLGLPHIQAFIETLKSTEFKDSLREVEGYTFENCGDIINI